MIKLTRIFIYILIVLCIGSYTASADPNPPFPPDPGSGAPMHGGTSGNQIGSSGGGGSGLKPIEPPKTEFIPFDQINPYAGGVTNVESGVLEKEMACLAEFSELTPDETITMVDELYNKIQKMEKSGDKQELRDEIIKLQEFTAALNTTIHSMDFENNFAKNRANRANSNLNYAVSRDFEGSERPDNWAVHYLKRSINALSKEEWVKVRSAMIKENCDILRDLY